MKKKGYKQISEQDFNSIKALQAAGVKSSQTSRAVGRASGTISRIYASENYEQYKEKLKAEASRQKKPVEPKLELVAADVIKETVQKAIENGGLFVTTFEQYTPEGVRELVTEGNKSGVTIAFTPNK